MPNILWPMRGEVLWVGEWATCPPMPLISSDLMPKLKRFVPNHLLIGIMCKWPFRKPQAHTDLYIAIVEELI